MPPDPLQIVSRAANELSSLASFRDGCRSAICRLRKDLGASFAFLARSAADAGMADVIAADGLHAADFRRLETRLPRSGLWRILHVKTPFVIDELAEDPVLNFLAFSSDSSTLAAVPVANGAAVLAIAFPRSMQVNEAVTLATLATVASLMAQALRVEQTVVSENARLASENRQLKNELRDRYDFGNLIGNSGGMRQALEQVRQIARSNTAVLLRGEPGTGRDTFANAIRFNSLRGKRSFIKVDVPATLGSRLMTELDSALAGADGGTIFLDEITAATPDVQRYLLELVREVTASTRDKPPRHNVRFIAATRHELSALAASGSFDPHLAAELSAHTIFLPPLRERRSDILLLADHFLEKHAGAVGKNILRITTPAIDMLAAYHFPGNVRELENVIQHAVSACDSNVIHGYHLPPTLQTAETTNTETRVTLEKAVANFERDLIQDALKSTRGNVAKAARMLDSTERILGYKIKKYGLAPGRYKKWR